MTRSKNRDEMIEVGLLFAVMFLPGYLTQDAGFDRSTLYDIGFNVRFLVAAVPQVFLIWFVANRDGLPQLYGLRRPTVRDLAFLPLLVLLLAAVALAFTFGRVGLGPDTGGTALVDMAEGGGMAVLSFALVICTAFATGYREELFFRSLLYVRLSRYGRSRLSAGVMSSLLFAVGHIYQGPLAFLGTFAMGGLLTGWFDRRRNVHVIAWAHGAYNLIILVMLFAGGTA